MHLGWWLTVLAVLASAPSARAAGDDEAWIERYMSLPGHSAGPVQIRPGFRVAWSDLGKFTEVPVKVTTDLGRVHRGYIERVDATRMVMRAELYGGYANLVLREKQVRSTELE